MRREAIRLKSEEPHLSDQELTLLANGEAPSQRARELRSHLAACWSCRVRIRDMESTLAELVHVRNQDVDARVPPADGARALLKAQLAALAASLPRRTFVWRTYFRAIPALAAVAIACLSVALGLMFFFERSSPALVLAVPRPNLTPGSVVLISRAEVCAAHPANNRNVPVSTQQRVFKAYGISNVDVRSYEVDYLVTPALGGSDDIRNLWPQSYSATAWNAHVKDDLEERMREMVCSGDLDLATAQREISQDWIAAYKKYFRTDQPLDVRQ